MAYGEVIVTSLLPTVTVDACVPRITVIVAGTGGVGAAIGRIGAVTIGLDGNVIGAGGGALICRGAGSVAGAFAATPVTVCI